MCLQKLSVHEPSFLQTVDTIVSGVTDFLRSVERFKEMQYDLRGTEAQLSSDSEVCRKQSMVVAFTAIGESMQANLVHPGQAEVEVLVNGELMGALSPEKPERSELTLNLRAQQAYKIELSHEGAGL